MITILSTLLGILFFQTGLVIYHFLFRKDIAKLEYALKFLSIGYKRVNSALYEGYTTIVVEDNKYIDSSFFYFDNKGNFVKHAI